MEQPHAAILIREAIRDVEERCRLLEGTPRRLSIVGRAEVRGCKDFCRRALAAWENDRLETASNNLIQAREHLREAERSQGEYEKLYDRIAADLRASRRRLFKKHYPGPSKRERHAAKRT